MESRKITVVSTQSQKKSVFMSSATTLEELKRDLRQNNINYEGMTFYEGTSKTELIDDSSILPHDIPYKDQVTNELVFMLTNTKKIKSGILSRERTELYDKIKKMNLQEKCISLLGKNYTQCSSVALKQIVDDACGIHGKDENNTQVQDFHKIVKSTVEFMINLLNSKEFQDDINSLITKHFPLSISDNEEIKLPAKKSNTTSSYSDDEINEMFDFIEEE